LIWARLTCSLGQLTRREAEERGKRKEDRGKRKRGGEGEEEGGGRREGGRGRKREEGDTIKFSIPVQQLCRKKRKLVSPIKLDLVRTRKIIPKSFDDVFFGPNRT
jgi:hypothetical protein